MSEREHARGRAPFLRAYAMLYVVWTAIPVVNVVLFSFNQNRSLTQWGGASMRWYLTDPNNSIRLDPTIRAAVFQSLRLSVLVVVIAVPIATAFALALNRWRGRGSGAANFVMMASFITPELIVAVSLFLLFVHLLDVIGLGSLAQLIGLVVLALAYPVVIVRARLLSLGPEYEEAAMDLGASPLSALRRVTIPLLFPAIFASAAVIFALSLDDFVIVQQLSKDASDQTVAMFIYNAARTAPTPSANAVGTLLLIASTAVIVAAAAAYRRAARRQGAGGLSPTGLA